MGDREKKIILKAVVTRKLFLEMAKRSVRDMTRQFFLEAFCSYYFHTSSNQALVIIIFFCIVAFLSL